MQRLLSRVTRRTPAVAVLACTVWSAVALAQPHAVRHGLFTLSSSVVNTQSISAETARQHGIEPSEQRAVLNVVVFRDVDGVQWPIRAAVSATRTTLLGVQRDVELRQVEDQGRVSYVGTFEFVPREVLDFSVTARIDPASPLLELSFRERMTPTQPPASTR
ncbi:DUF4426 domain-containing protein [Hydrogenophaga sp.]|uniref:DUF4426 domain-containing protein n=1 Tax=Hydrogenophaga sp. TaxID=1904254 RepID=UPI002FC89741